METYLITLSLGPVQSLIEAARRTRDLWCGSWLLSEAARAAARVLHENHRDCLIFPCPDNPDSDLEPQKEFKDEANIANILRAEVKLACIDEAQALCKKARDAAANRLEELCDLALAEVSILPIHEALWNTQKRDILEFFSAWIVVKNDNYKAASEQLGGLLAARKATRDFAPAAIDAHGPGFKIPKSSLDGARESVINIPHKEREFKKYKTALRKLGLGTGEELDALALTKRLAGDVDQFTAYSRIAAEPWIASLTPKQQLSICNAYEPLVKLATRVGGNSGIYSAVPFDAQLLYGFRLENALSSKDMESEDKAALDAMRQLLRDLGQKTNADGKPVSTPVPYAAILKADGDRMGKLLSRAEKVKHSREISKALHSFASNVREIVREHRGHAIYSGGDDVLALLPLTDALACARALADDFADKLACIAIELEMPKDQRPTLSVGLGIGHLMEPLGSLRARADRAERAAKGNGLGEDQEGKTRERNALAITLGIRSGGDHQWRAQWSDQAAFHALTRFTEAFKQGKLPSRVAYDLRAIDLRLAWLRDSHDDTAVAMRKSEVTRMLDRARTRGERQGICTDLRNLILERAFGNERQSLNALAETLIIARWLSARTATDLGER